MGLRGTSAGLTRAVDGDVSVDEFMKWMRLVIGIMECGVRALVPDYALCGTACDPQCDPMPDSALRDLSGQRFCLSKPMSGLNGSPATGNSAFSACAMVADAAEMRL
jgi:hypothetical protein